MDKDAIQSMGLIALLLVLIIGATIYSNKLQLVATRPEVNAITSKTLKMLLDEHGEASEKVGASQSPSDDACPAGCEAATTPTPAAGREDQWRSDPIPYVRDRLAETFSSELSDGRLESVYATDTTLWWRSDEENYRILIDGAKTLTMQVPSTPAAYKLTPDTSDKHPALRHPMLEKVATQIRQAFKKIGFKQSSFASCPVSENYDPFNNCVATFQRDQMRCSLIAGYGKFSEWTSSSDPYLRLELACSDNYDLAYQQAAPYLYAIQMISPAWLVSDPVVYSVSDNGSVTNVNFGYRTASFQRINDGLRLLGDDKLPSCNLVRATGEMSVECY